MANFKGDSIQWEFTVDDDITNWKIRAELYDDEGASIKKATSNSGGSDDQIQKTSISASSSKFVVKIASGESTGFDDNVKLEVEVDTGSTVGGEEEIITIFQGSVSLRDEQITWITP